MENNVSKDLHRTKYILACSIRMRILMKDASLMSTVPVQKESKVRNRISYQGMT